MTNVIFDDKQFDWVHNTFMTIILVCVLMKCNDLMTQLAVLSIAAVLYFIGKLLITVKSLIIKAECDNEKMVLYGRTWDQCVILEDIEYVQLKIENDSDMDSENHLTIRTMKGEILEFSFSGGSDRLSIMRNELINRGVSIKNPYNIESQLDYIIKRPRTTEYNEYEPNSVEIVDRMFYVILSLLVLIVGGLFVYTNSFLVIGRREMIILHDEPIYIALLSLVSAVVYLVSFVIDHIDKRNNEGRYKYVQGLSLRLMCYFIIMALVVDGLFYNTMTKFN